MSQPQNLPALDLSVVEGPMDKPKRANSFRKMGKKIKVRLPPPGMPPDRVNNRLPAKSSSILGDTEKRAEPYLPRHPSPACNARFPVPPGRISASLCRRA